MERFINRRNALEHEGWELPGVTYHLKSVSEVAIVEPDMDGLTLTQHVGRHLDRALGFVEDVVVYGLQTQVRFPYIIAGIEPSKRSSDAPYRFKFDFKTPDIESWSIHSLPDYGFRQWGWGTEDWGL